MNDAGQKSNQNVVSGTQIKQGSSQAVDQFNGQNTPPMASQVGSLQKEQAPLSAPVDRYIKASEVEPVLSKEEVEAGVRSHSNNITLTDEHIKFGIDHAPASMPVKTVIPGLANPPGTVEEAKKEIKETKSDDSFRGLLLEVLKSLQRAGLGK